MRDLEHPRVPQRRVPVCLHQRRGVEGAIGLRLTDRRRAGLAGSGLGPGEQRGADAAATRVRMHRGLHAAVRDEDVGFRDERSGPVEHRDRVHPEVEARPPPIIQDVVHVDIRLASVVQLAEPDERGHRFGLLRARRPDPEAGRELHAAVHPGHRTGATGPGSGWSDPSDVRTSSKSVHGLYGTPCSSQYRGRSSFANTTSE